MRRVPWKPHVAGHHLGITVSSPAHIAADIPRHLCAVQRENVHISSHASLGVVAVSPEHLTTVPAELRTWHALRDNHNASTMHLSQRSLHSGSSCGHKKSTNQEVETTARRQLLHERATSLEGGRVQGMQIHKRKENTDKAFGPTGSQIERRQESDTQHEVRYSAAGKCRTTRSTHRIPGWRAPLHL